MTYGDLAPGATYEDRTYGTLKLAKAPYLASVGDGLYVYVFHGASRYVIYAYPCSPLPAPDPH
jgi:hypothetical protein